MGKRAGPRFRKKFCFTLTGVTKGVLSGVASIAASGGESWAFDLVVVVVVVTVNLVVLVTVTESAEVGVTRGFIWLTTGGVTTESILLPGVHRGS